jgi:ceramide glucosyltransferase
MNLLVRVLLCVAVMGSVTSTIYCAMAVVAALRFGWRKRREDRAAAEFLPPVSVLKPLHGAEPSLEKNLEGFFQQEYPEYELLFCARYENDEGLQAARRVAAKFPGVTARFLTCGEPEYPNPKMWSLAMMGRAARYEHLVTSDADARVAKDYLRQCMKAMAGGKTALSSCMYIGTVDPGAGLSAQLDAIGKSVEMVAGCLVADMVEGGTKFALGVTMILPKESWDLAGGYDDLGQHWAEDFVLGNRLAASGRKVTISNHVIRLMVLDTPFAESFRNQVRWMKSTRRSRPWGHLGSGLTFAVPFGLIGLGWGLLSGHAALGLVWLAAMVLNRVVLAGAMLGVLGEPKWLGQAVLYPLRDLLGSVLWVGSYWGRSIRYHDSKLELSPDGRVVARKRVA